MSLFITFEGLDGSGKSTQAGMLAAALRDRNFTVIEVREPGSTSLGEHLRSLILDPTGPPVSPRAMTLMYSAARAQLVEEVIAPALEDGHIVVCDRFSDSTIAYQSFGLHLDLESVMSVVRFATSGLGPHMTVYIDVEPEAGMGRSSQRGNRDRIDAQALSFHTRVREGYEYLIALEPNRWYRLDGHASVDDIHRHVIDIVEPLLYREADAV